MCPPACAEVTGYRVVAKPVRTALAATVAVEGLGTPTPDGRVSGRSWQAGGQPSGCSPCGAARLLVSLPERAPCIPLQCALLRRGSPLRLAWPPAQLEFSFPSGAILPGISWEVIAQASNGVAGGAFDPSGAGEFSAPPVKLLIDAPAPVPLDPLLP